MLHGNEGVSREEVGVQELFAVAKRCYMATSFPSSPHGLSLIDVRAWYGGHLSQTK